VPDVAPFPVDVLPVRLRQLVEEIAFAVNCPVDYAAIPLLVFAGGAIANSRQLAITTTHRQSACIYGAYVGRPGTTKSAPLKILRRPFDRVQTRHFQAWLGEMEEWQELQERRKKRGRKSKQDDGEATEDGGGGKAGPKPILKRVIVSDTTTESLAITLSQNPRGVVMVRPELTALMTSMNQYKGGGRGQDRQVYLSLWDGDNIVIDRKSDKDRGGAPLFAHNPFTTIVGTIQPDVLRQLRGDATRGNAAVDDGFFDRWLCAYPNEVPAVGEQWRDVSQPSLLAWDDTIDALLGLPMVEDVDETRPFFVKLSSCGRKAWEAFTEAHAAEINGQDFPVYLFGHWSKLRGYCGRLALILHHLRWACGEESGDAVDGESVTRAARLVAYFKSHAMKVYAVMDADPKIADARKVLKWIVAQGKPSFARKDAYQSLKGTFKTVDDLDAVLAVLHKHGLIRQQPPQAHPGRGPKPGPTYDVNPHAAEANYRNCGNYGNPPGDDTSTAEGGAKCNAQHPPGSCNSHDSCNSGPREVLEL
jgi:hypothetical protein